MVLAFQLVAAPSGIGRVLCLATDGHVAVEVAHPGACAQEATRHPGRRADASTVATACDEHACADIALAQPPSRVTATGDDHAPAILAAVTLPPSDPHRAPPVPSASAVGRGDGGVLARRSIVLRV